MVTSNKIIQLPIDEELLSQLDGLTRAEGTSRAALIRRACREYIQRLQDAKLDEAYARGYRRIPDDPAVGKAQLSMAARVLPKEDW